MASKTAVVTTNQPELKEIAKDCVYFAEPTINSIALMANQALANENKEMLEKAYHRSKEFSLKSSAKRFLELYAQ
jgi:glycosyltransferase involved in cell wall biosynthesis